jgi:hypothetical protein
MTKALWMRRLSDECGLSMLEIVIASGLFMVLLTAVLTMLDSGTRTERAQQARHETLLELRDAMTEVSTAARQARAVMPESTRSRLVIETLRTGAERWTTFELVNGELLVRTCSTLPCTSAGQPLTANVITGTFCYDPPGCVSSSPSGAISSIRISLAVQPTVASVSEIALSTDVELRNL